jgi:hypothetical protein
MHQDCVLFKLTLSTIRLFKHCWHLNPAAGSTPAATQKPGAHPSGHSTDWWRCLRLASTAWVLLRTSHELLPLMASPLLLMMAAQLVPSFLPFLLLRTPWAAGLLLLLLMPSCSTAPF